MKWFCLHLFNLFSSTVPLLNPDFLRLSGGIGSGTLVENELIIALLGSLKASSNQGA